ncbi:hypothetical protein ACIQVT_34565 [Streptomyces sp. NPDC100445]|uniref:hypothetical protein n=1 Tax=Streptomyces sp. NPDC100445 TaxID=3366102 RepID=UPI0038023FCB
MNEVHPSADAAHQYADVVQEVTEPVAVAVVSAEPLRVRQQPRRQFTTGQVTVTPGGPAVRIIGANPFRERLIIGTQAGGDIYIGPDRDTLTAGSGFWLARNMRVELTTRYEVWAIADPGNSGATSPTFLAEHTDG